MAAAHKYASPTPAQLVTINAVHSAAAAQRLRADLDGVYPDGTHVYTVSSSRQTARYMVVRITTDGRWQCERKPAALPNTAHGRGERHGPTTNND